VVPLGTASPPPGLMVTENRAFEANILQNHPDYSFYTSERNDGHENRFCHNGDWKKAVVYFARNPASWVSGELPFIFEILA
jgi:hypothetical protein